MAGPYYVRSTDGSDADSGLTWALAKATLAGALAVAAAGERIWVSQVHAETQATAMTLTSAGTAAAPVEILCGNDGAEPPTALATTATITTTGVSALSISGFAFVYGCAFNCATGVSNAGLTLFVTAATAGALVFDTCALNLVTTSSGGNARLAVGILSSAVVDQIATLINTTVTFGNAAQGIVPRARLRMEGGSIAATGSVPTAVFLLPGGNVSQRVLVRGVNCAAVTTALVNVAAGSGRVDFEQCKIGAGCTATTGTNPGRGGPVVWMDNCDSADTQYRMQRHQYEGDVYSETTVVRTGGASDGTTPLAHKMVSSAGARFTAPLYGPDIMLWNSAVGSAKTVTIEIIHDSLTNLKDNEVWLEVEYLGTAGFPLSLFASDRMTDILSTAADQTTSTVAWTTTGLTNPNKQKLAVTFTPQEIGWFRARVALAKASYTIYVDPTDLTYSTSGKQRLSPGGPYVNDELVAAGGGGGLLRANLSGGML